MFASLGSAATVHAVRSAAAWEELLRLRRVSQNATWAVSDDKINVVVWQKGFRAKDLPRDTPTLIKGSPASKWAAMEWGRNATSFVSAFGDGEFLAKMLRRTSAVHRSPLGSGYTFRAQAKDLFGTNASIGSQPFYVNQKIDAELTPTIWSKLDLGDDTYCVEDASCSFDNDAAHAAELPQRPIVALWAGAKGAVAPLHMDRFHNMFFQFRGIAFSLFHPESTSWRICIPDFTCVIDKRK